MVLKFNSKIKIFYQNVRGLKTKTNIFFSNMLTCEYDIIILCESWLADDVLDSELFSDRYLVYRRDRDPSCFYSDKKG